MTKADSTIFAHYIFMDNEFFLPTITGVPLRIALSGTFTPGIKGGLKIAPDMVIIFKILFWFYNHLYCSLLYRNNTTSYLCLSVSTERSYLHALCWHWVCNSCWLPHAWICQLWIRDAHQHFPWKWAQCQDLLWTWQCQVDHPCSNESHKAHQNDVSRVLSHYHIEHDSLLLKVYWRYLNYSKSGTLTLFENKHGVQ